MLYRKIAMTWVALNCPAGGWRQQAKPIHLGARSGGDGNHRRGSLRKISWSPVKLTRMSAEIKLLAIDLDHTLLTSDWRLTPRNHAAISRVAKEGVKIALVTGRMPRATIPYADQLSGAVRYLVCYNGALVMDLNAQSIIASTPIEPGIWQPVVDFARSGQRQMVFFDHDQVQATALEIGTDAVLCHYMRRTGAEIIPSTLGARRAFHKFFVYDGRLARRYDPDQESPLEQETYEALLDLNIPELQVLKTRLGYVECTSARATKLAMCKFLGALNGWSNGNLMAIGDGYNDAEMVGAAGIGVAVSNAVPPCLEAADIVVASNDDDGVAEAIDQVW
jgi:Cof subfamily protein (haloacid dehalogenase superfamily)